MKKMKSLNLARKIIFSVFLVATAITIAGDGNNWTPLMALATGFMLYGERRLNGEYRAEYKAWKKEQKNARRSAIRTSKVIHFGKLTTNKISEKRRAVK